MKVIVDVSDLQVPYHHVRAVAALEKFIKAYRPDEVHSVGDVLDSPQISRWNRGQKGEFDGQLGKHRDEAVRILERLKVKHLSRSNHDDRIELYIEGKAPGFLGLPELTTERFLRLDDLGIKFHRQPYEFAPGWYLAHGDEGGLSQIPGTTALKLSQKIGASVVIGHTHRAAIKPDTDSVGGRVLRTRFGVEVGCLMDMRKADYVMKKGGSANWQLAFGVMFIEGRHVQPHIVFMRPDGSFVFDKKEWRA